MKQKVYDSFLTYVSCKPGSAYLNNINYYLVNSISNANSSTFDMTNYSNVSGNFLQVSAFHNPLINPGVYTSIPNSDFPEEQSYEYAFNIPASANINKSLWYDTSVNNGNEYYFSSAYSSGEYYKYDIQQTDLNGEQTMLSASPITFSGDAGIFAKACLIAVHNENIFQPVAYIDFEKTMIKKKDLFEINWNELGIISLE